MESRSEKGKMGEKQNMGQKAERGSEDLKAGQNRIKWVKKAESGSAK